MLNWMNHMEIGKRKRKNLPPWSFPRGYERLQRADHSFVCRLKKKRSFVIVCRLHRNSRNKNSDMRRWIRNPPCWLNSWSDDFTIINFNISHFISLSNSKCICEELVWTIKQEIEMCFFISSFSILLIFNTFLIYHYPLYKIVEYTTYYGKM